jgi:hypothetical protein
METTELKLNPRHRVIRTVSLGLLVGASLVMLTGCEGGKKTNPLMENMTPVTPEIRPVVPAPHALPEP